MIHETLKRYKLTNEELLTKLGIGGKLSLVLHNSYGEIIIECLEDAPEMVKECPDCEGSGTVNKMVCEFCGGDGNVSTEVI